MAKPEPIPSPARRAEPDAPLSHRATSSGRIAIQETFVEAVEVWLPHGGGLRHQSGYYGRHGALARASFVTTFERGLGLPGAVLESGRATLCTPVGSETLRERRALEAGLETALALPIVREQQVRAIVVFWSGKAERSSLAVWSTRGGPAAETREPTCSQRYGGTAEAFNRATVLAERSLGLRLPVFEFPCTTPANSMGLALPNLIQGEPEQVVTLVGSASATWARAFELWQPNAQGQLQRTQGCYGAGLDEFGAASDTLQFAPGEGLPGRVFESGLPLVFVGVHARPFVRAEAAERAGLEYGIGIPFFNASGVSAVLTWLG